MKPIHHGLLCTGVLLLGGFFVYKEYKGRSVTQSPVIQNAFFNKKGYSDMMKLHPNYYNSTSTEGVESSPADYNSETGINTPWVLGVNGGNGSEVSAGWTGWPDAYAANVGNNWKEQINAGSHL